MMIRILVILFILALVGVSYGKKNEEDSEHMPPTPIGQIPPGNILAPDTPNPNIPTPQDTLTPMIFPTEVPITPATPVPQKIAIDRTGLYPDGSANYWLVIPNTFGIAQMKIVLELPKDTTATNVKAAPENKCPITSEQVEDKLTISMQCMPTLTQGIRLAEWGLPKKVQPTDIKIVSCSINAQPDSCFLAK